MAPGDDLARSKPPRKRHHRSLDIDDYDLPDWFPTTNWRSRTHQPNVAPCSSLLHNDPNHSSIPDVAQGMRSDASQASDTSSSGSSDSSSSNSSTSCTSDSDSSDCNTEFDEDNHAQSDDEESHDDVQSDDEETDGSKQAGSTATAPYRGHPDLSSTAGLEDHDCGWNMQLNKAGWLYHKAELEGMLISLLHGRER